MKYCELVGKKKAGFTLVEMMIVIALIGILAATAVPAVQNWLPNYRMKNSIRQIHSAFQTARIQAIKRNANVAVLFNTANDSYIVYLDNDLNGTQDAGETTLKSGQIADDVDMYQTTFGGAWANKTFFNSRGLINDTGAVELRNDRNRYMRVNLLASGHPDIESSINLGVTWVDD